MIEVVRADITTLAVDAIVNAANSALAGGGGVDGAIHRVAGRELAAAARPFAPCPPGHAVVTPGFRLPARYVIHAVGPVWDGGTREEPETLRRTYESAFRAAAEIAVGVMRAHAGAVERVVACLFDDESLALYRGLLDGSAPGASDGPSRSRAG